MDLIDYRLEIDVLPFRPFFGVGCGHPKRGRGLHRNGAN